MAAAQMGAARVKAAAAKALLEAPRLNVADIVRDEAQALADMRRVALRISKTEGDLVAQHVRTYADDAETLARLVLAYTEPPNE